MDPILQLEDTIIFRIRIVLTTILGVEIRNKKIGAIFCQVKKKKEVKFVSFGTRAAPQK